jgi:hypothetical protein
VLISRHQPNHGDTQWLIESMSATASSTSSKTHSNAQLPHLELPIPASHSRVILGTSTLGFTRATSRKLILSAVCHINLVCSLWPQCKVHLFSSPVWQRTVYGLGEDLPAFMAPLHGYRASPPRPQYAHNPPTWPNLMPLYTVCNPKIGSF